MKEESLKSFRQRMAENQRLPNNCAFFKNELEKEAGCRMRYHITCYYYASNLFFYSNYNLAFEILNPIIDEIDCFRFISEYGRIYNLLGLIWFVKGNRYMAVDMYMKGIQVAKSHKNYDILAAVYSNLGLCYLDIDQDEEAIRYFNRSIELEKYVKPINVSALHINLGEAYLKIGEYNKALDNFIYSRSMMNSKNDTFVKLYVCFMESYYGLGDKQKGDEYMDKALSELENAHMSNDGFEAVKILFKYISKRKDIEKMQDVISVLRRFHEEKSSDEIGLFLVSSEARYYHLTEDYKKESELLTKANEYLNRSMKVVADEAHKAMLEKNKMARLQRMNVVAQKKNQTLTKLALTDSLTGVLNRHAYNKAITALNKTKRIYKYFTFVFIDIDNFKGFNDKYGHLAGDECLSSLGEILVRKQRRGISFYRFGGDEFVGFFENMSKDTAIDICKEINAEILSVSEKTKKPRTVSFGIYTSRGLSENLLTYLNYADEALYRSKNSCQKGRIEIIK